MQALRTIYRYLAAILVLGVLAILGFVQVILAWAGTDSLFVGSLHAVNAVVLLGLAGSLAREAWWGSRRPPTATARAA
jgi:uncharacterized membrane protein YedE/YeeE